MQPNSNPYSITLPYQEIKNGKNHLIFKYRYAERPSDHYDSSDTRTLSVDFKRIQFIEQAFQNSNLTVSKIQNKIIQQPRTLMNYFYRLPADCHLEVEVDEMSDNTAANIEIRSDNNDYLQDSFNMRCELDNEIGDSYTDNVSGNIPPLEIQFEDLISNITPDQVIKLEALTEEDIWVHINNTYPALIAKTTQRCNITFNPDSTFLLDTSNGATLTLTYIHYNIQIEKIG